MRAGSPRARARHRWRAAVAAFFLAGVAGGCEFDRVNVPNGKPRVVVHAVLDPTIFQGESFYVLVERTLTGHVMVDTTVGFDPNDPVTSGSGEPVSGAEVRILYDASGGSNLGSVGTGIEVVTERSDGKGRGVYRFVQRACNGMLCPPTPPNAVRVFRGGQYRLQVTADGSVTTGALRIPDGIAYADSGPFPLNRDRDTLRLSWKAAAEAKRYLLRIETPYGPFTLFTDALDFTVTGELRNFDVNRFPRVLVAGFEQRVLVAAVDQNYFDYYRSANNPFTGSGIINHLEGGGIGVFGGFVPLRRYTYEVVATVDEPIEGRWLRANGGDPTEALTLYADGALLSGNVRSQATFERHGVLGSRAGTQVTLHLLRGESAADTVVADVHGTLNGDSIVLTPWLEGPSSTATFQRATTP